MFKIKQNIKKIIHSFKKDKIKAVHEDDLMEMLKSMDISEDMENGKFSCIYCGDIINLNNIEVFFKRHGEIKFVCSKRACMSNL